VPPRRSSAASAPYRAGSPDSACAEPGDSGGPLYALDKGLGLLSGALGNCLGGTQITWFQPITPIMVGYFLQIRP
jgi:trypsin